MQKILNRLPLPIKLGLLAVLPIIFILYVSFQLHEEKKARITVVERFISQFHNISNINKLIERLQVERRYAYGYAISNDWKAELVIAINKSDEGIKEVERSGGKLFKNVKQYSMFDVLINRRQLMFERKMSPQTVLDLYTGILSRLNTLAHISADNVTYLASLNEELRGQRVLSQMVTYLGNLRADVYNSLYVKDDLSKGKKHIENNYNYFKALEREFRDKTSLVSWQEFGEIKNTEPYMLTIKTLEDLSTGSAPEHQFDAEEWWRTSASAIDAMRELQRELLGRVEQKAASIHEAEKVKINLNMLLLLSVLLFLAFILLAILRNISGAVNDLRGYSKELALGRAGYKVQYYTHDVIGQLSESIREIENNNLQLANAANRIGQGDFSVNVLPRSPEDVLGNAVVAMKEDLNRFRDENLKKIWLQTGVNKIAERMMRETDLQSFCSGTLEELIRYLNASIGVFYLAENRELEYIAGYAIENNGSLNKRVDFGRTIAGKAAENQQTVYLQDVPEDYLKIASLTGNTSPRQILIIPIVYNNMVEGVIEIATIEQFTSDQRELIPLITPGIGVSLVAAKGRARQQELLEETQAQAEELQTQHSELENMNTELEAQTQKLQASEEELRVQQEELQQTNVELEERSRVLQERNLQIRKTAEELAQATKYKTEFLANISHELRTPLNSILLLSRLLQENNEKNLNDEQVEYAKVIQNSGSGLLTLIDEILDLSKIEAGKMQLEFSEVSLASVFSDIESLFKPLVKEKKLNFEIREKMKVRNFESDKGRLEQILKNLISNAIKFTSKGEIILTVEDTPNGEILFQVKDTGIGIPADKQQSVFEAFKQADGSTKRKYGGTGLGLSISKELAKLLGGDISLKSEPGKGSEFTLRLPIKRGESETPARQEEKTKQPEALTVDNFLAEHIPASVSDDRTSLSRSDKSILIVEDDVNFAKALLDFTRRRGYKGIVAVRGDEGIELAQKYKPTGILLDVRLPVKSGWEVMDVLKSKPETRHIPVHIMSSENQRKQSMLRGAVNFIDKPVAMEQMDEIFTKLEYVLDKKDKKVLIIEDNARHAKALAYFLETNSINTELRSSVEDGLQSLRDKAVDCVILDMGVPDSKAYHMLETAKESEEFRSLPIIIFTGRSLSISEEQKIKKYADTVIVKTAQSYQRMLDEVSIFLHQMDEKRESSSDSVKLRGLNEVLENKTVLIADDDVRNVFSLSKALEKYQMKVLTAVDGKEAMAQLESHPQTDLVLLDMMMPEMDGYETAKKIRQDKRFRELPVIAVTAKAMTGDRDKCIQAGASDYITKPVDIDQLLSLLRVWLYER